MSTSPEVGITTSPSPDVTGLLRRWSHGERSALDQLVPVVYDELKRIARARLARERPDHSLNTTGLVHEAYVRLVDVNRVEWQDRNHFLSMAARVMRRVLVDYARNRGAQKRLAGPSATGSEDPPLLPARDLEVLLDLDDALRTLEASHPRAHAVIEAYYFGGLTQQEIADALSLSQPTVSADLRFARAWIARAMDGDTGLGQDPGDEGSRR